MAREDEARSVDADGRVISLQARAVLRELRGHADPRNVAGMARLGITPRGTLGVSIPMLRGLARRLGRDHRLAQELWRSGIHEARILASMIDEPERVTEAQMERWVGGFDSWDVCDQICGNLFRRTSFAWRKAVEWSGREEEFVRRAGFVMMATLAVADKEAPDARFARFLPLIMRRSTDDRNFVRKAVNWALRQIGKRSPGLRLDAIRTARRLLRSTEPSARWIARDALRELER